MPTTATSTTPSIEEMTTFREALIEALKVPRSMSGQVFNTVTDTYACSTEEEIRIFFTSKLAELEEYELDLLLSPQFTAREDEKKAFASTFGLQQFSNDTVEFLAKDIQNEKIITPITLNSGDLAECLVSDILVERYISTLNLNKTIEPEIIELIKRDVPQHFQGLLGLMSRDGLYQFEKYRHVYADLIGSMKAQNSFSEEILTFMVDTIRTYKPQNLSDLTEKMDRLITSCTDDMARAEERGYHHHELKAGAAGNIHDAHEAIEVRAQYAEIIRKAKALQAVCV